MMDFVSIEYLCVIRYVYILCVYVRYHLVDVCIGRY